MSGGSDRNGSDAVEVALKLEHTKIVKDDAILVRLMSGKCTRSSIAVMQFLLYILRVVKEIFTFWSWTYAWS
ncbi:hypothetical protein HA466_0273120 [Hirschfeldia incana]|nr:hypothetical protein HA466_0273120 [Hirschfeldia incana]